MNYRQLDTAYSRLGRIEHPPKTLLKILIYGYMRKEISSRRLEACCRENINYMYLLEGQRAPDHHTINRFRKNVLTTAAGQDLLRQLVVLFHKSGFLNLEAMQKISRLREAMEAKITSDKGRLLRVNRSIQSEGTFAYIKEDLDFRRFLLRGKVKVEAEWLLFSMAYNILKLHHKIQNKRLETALHAVSSFPAGL